MKKLLAILMLSAACASTQQPSNAPTVQLRLDQVNTPSDVFYYAGPVNVQYQLTIANPTNQPLTLERLDLATVGPGAYSLRANGTPMKLTVPPNGTATYTISAWGRAHGGYLTRDEPVTLRATAYFKGPSGSFVKMFNENISQMASR